VALKNKDGDEAQKLTESLYRSVVYNPSERVDIIGSDEIPKTPEFLKQLELDFNTSIASGFNVVDEEIGGWRNGQFIAIIAPTYSGKTWLLLQSVLGASRSGCKSLVFSGEMPKEEVWSRLLCLHFGLPVKRALQGRLSEKEKKAVKKDIESGSFKGDIIVMSAGQDAEGPDIIRRKILQYSPDVVFVDSWYALLPRESERSARWERLADLAASFKRMALDLGVPIIVTHQMGRQGAERTKGARLTDVAGSFDLIGWLDIAIVPVLNDDLKKTREIGVIVRKVRNFDPFSFTLKFNVNDGEPMEVSKEAWILEDAQKFSPAGLSDEEIDSLARQGH
jgi:replicative DNA helicase